MAKDYYAILGISKGASDVEIKKAYRKLAQQHHPDRNKGNKESEQKFKEINEAYEVLSDKQKRTQYDQFGEAGVHFGDQAQGFSSGFDFSDFSSGFGDIFETFFGASGRGASSRRQSKRRKGADIEASIRLKFEEAAFGCEKELKITKSAVCSHCRGNAAEPGTKIISCTVCHGTGEIRSVRNTFLGQMTSSRVCDVCDGEGKIPEQKCTVCHGTTRVRKTEHTKIKIPAGIDNGATIRISDKGEGGIAGGSSGDLFIHIQIEPSKDFARKGYDIYSERHIHLLQAVLGDEISVSTLHGNITLKIPAGTQGGSLFRLKEKGIQHLHGEEIGDHFVKIIVDIPSKLGKKERELYHTIAKEAKLNLHPDEGFLKKIGL